MRGLLAHGYAPFKGVGDGFWKISTAHDNRGTFRCNQNFVTSWRLGA